MATGPARSSRSRRASKVRQRRGTPAETNPNGGAARIVTRLSTPDLLRQAPTPRQQWIEQAAAARVAVEEGNATLYGRDRSTVDDDLTPMNRRGSRRDEEANKLRHLFGSTGSTDGDPTERLHQPLASGRLVVPVLFCKALHHPMRRIGLDHAG